MAAVAVAEVTQLHNLLAGLVVVEQVVSTPLEIPMESQEPLTPEAAAEAEAISTAMVGQVAPV